MKDKRIGVFFTKLRIPRAGEVTCGWGRGGEVLPHHHSSTGAILTLIMMMYDDARKSDGCDFDYDNDQLIEVIRLYADYIADKDCLANHPN